MLLRGFQLNDAQPLFDAICTDRDTLAPWVPWASTDHHALHQSMAYIARQMEALRTSDLSKGLGLGVFEADSGRLIGGTGFHDVQSTTASCEIGYWMAASERGKGYTTEASAHLLSWLFTPQEQGGMGFARVRVFCSSLNKASSRVLEKLGLVAEVRQRRDYFVDGYGPTDRLGWGVLSEEWDCERHRMRNPSL
jgi:RimJ/RimL family protein N-acetyltransferase